MTPNITSHAMHSIANHAFFTDHAGAYDAADFAADELWDPLQALMHFQVKASPGLPVSAADLQRLQQVKDYLRDSFLSPELSLDLLCRKFGLNEFKLKRGFKQLFGHTVFGYVQELKMKTARRLLAEKKMNVNEVADYLGYSAPNHFSAAFKKMYGHVPSRLMSFAG
ncbi:AraC family transcriptional regulator [Chitinophaga lutea]|uniref:AraC family transcriptional regulator n=1 Tax=Chitinophaga lutea TaxID=2488634 RepID=A0A3N4Q963_9BACT|nr:AraC family transcriptional regulator [Chitinophaga lutea]RPE14091.1 AraC family transcriptional regulator [Chitinophaga lutea]